MSSNFGLTLVLVDSCARAALDVACFLVVARVEGVLDDAPDQLRREAAGQLRGKNRGESVEAVAPARRRLGKRRRFSFAIASSDTRSMPDDVFSKVLAFWHPPGSLPPRIFGDLWHPPAF